MLEKNSDSEVHVEKIEQRPTASIAFGLERIGLIAVQAPILSCIILVALIIGAMFGIERIKIDDSLSQLFRSNSKEYQQYEAETKRFPATEFDVLVVVEGKTLLDARQSREAARSRHRSATRRRHARPDFAVLGAPGAGARQAAGGAVPVGTAARRRLRQVHRDRQSQRDHPRQAVVRGRHAGADRAVARARRRRQQQARPRRSARSAS